jgi:enterochelin esterase-like enzyme
MHRILILLWVCTTFSQHALGQLEEPTLQAQRLSERFRIERCQLWSDGDHLTAYYDGDVESVQIMIGGQPRPLKKVAKSTAWVWTGEFDQLEKGILTYSWDIRPAKTDDKPKTFLWRGPKSPPAVKVVDSLRGVVSKHFVKSRALNIEREVTVYFPPGSPNSPRVVYAADGQDIAIYAPAVEAAILEGRIHPTALIGVHNGGYDGGPLEDLSKYDPDKDFRAIEYLPILANERFGKHEKFFAEEIPTWAEEKFGVSSRPEHRAVFGFSNGGRFAATVGVDRPEVFGNVIAFSLAVGVPPEFEKKPPRSVRFQFCAGRWEIGFLKLTTEFHDALQKAGVQTELVSRVSGHDSIMWQEEFVHALEKIYAKKAGR